MYRIVIADDEYLTRKGLIRSVDWNKLGFEVVDDFDDGEELLEYVRRNPVDVVLSDIVMCKLGGLDIAKANVEENLGFKMILLSGFQEFEYAQKGIKYGVNAYLLKPISLQELQEEILKIKVLLDRQAFSICNKMPIFKELREMYFRTLWIGESITPQENSALILLLNLNYSKHIDVTFFWNKLSDEVSERKISPNDWLAKNDCYFFSLPNIPTVALFWNINQADKNTCLARRNEIFKLLNSDNDIFFKMYEKTIEVICDSDYEFNNFTPELFFSDIIILLKKWDFTADDNFSTDNFNFTGWNVSSYSLKNVIFFCKIAVMLLEWRIVKCGYSYYNIRKSIDFEELYLLNNFADISDWAHKTLASLYTIFKEQCNQDDYYNIRYIITYINTHLNEDLSVENLSNIAHLNAAYFGRIFKKSVGKNVKSFVYETRMKKAIELLHDKKYHISEIAAMVGYDTKYFFTVFKNYTGYSPSTYRKNFIK